MHIWEREIWIIYWITAFSIEKHKELRIKELDPNNLIGLTSMKSVYFLENKITKIHPPLFNNLNNLQEL